jgi:hypothetical protein
MLTDRWNDREGEEMIIPVLRREWQEIDTR